MNVEQMSSFFAVLALGSLGLGAVGLVGTFTPGAPQRNRQLRPALLPLALLIAAVATAGSLYYSEVAGYVPCEMCWYQRIAMYALVPVLTVAVARRDRAGGWYALVLALGGLGVSVYHYRLQVFGDSGSGASCDPAAPCTYQWVDSFGFVSIPFMAGCGFIGIAGAAAHSLRGAARGAT